MNLSVEIYKKWVNGIVEYKDGADFISSEPIETQILQGFQDSRGIEFMVRKNSDRLTGWLSYAYSRSTITIDGEHSEQQVNSGNPYPSNFDKPHSLNLVANYRISRRLSVSSAGGADTIVTTRYNCLCQFPAELSWTLSPKPSGQTKSSENAGLKASVIDEKMS